MSDFDFDFPADRRGTGSLKYDRYAGRDVIPLWVADMDFRSPPAVIDALHRRVEHGVFGYTRPSEELTSVVVDYLDRKHGAEIDPSWVVWLPGCVPALSMACASVGEAGSEVITFTPVYPPFLHVHRDSARVCREVPLAVGDDGRYAIDTEALAASVTSKTKVLLFCNPHNPVGRVFTRQETEGLAQFCHDHDLLLCADEIHCDLILDEQRTPHVSALTLSNELRDRTITLLAASKTYNIAGLACAYAVIPNAELRRDFVKAGGKLLPEISPLSFIATAVAYEQGEAWRQELLEYLRESWRIVHTFVREQIPRVKVTPLEATYLAWLDVRELNLPDPHQYFEEHGLGFSRGGDFGDSRFVRMNFGCTHETLRRALERLRAAVDCLH
ncbi:MAG: PatB family C-S lyase [Pirellulaceae bacterium]